MEMTLLKRVTLANMYRNGFINFSNSFKLRLFRLPFTRAFVLELSVTSSLDNGEKKYYEIIIMKYYDFMNVTK
jgi:hypothetical protein